MEVRAIPEQRGRRREASLPKHGLLSTRDRRETISSLLQERGSVTVPDLMAQFGVTDTSIRHDLTVLEELGKLRRVRGGAVNRGNPWPSDFLLARARENLAQKMRIGRMAAGLVSPGDVVFFDSGSTVLQVAVNIPPPKEITAITHAFKIVEEVGTWEKPHLICLGGLYLPEYQTSVGPLTLANLRDLTADIAFLGCDGLTLEYGLTTLHMLVGEVGAALAARARRVVLVADATKLGRSGFTPFAGLDAVNVLVTDDRADPTITAQIQQLGIEVLLA